MKISSILWLLTMAFLTACQPETPKENTLRPALVMTVGETETSQMMGIAGEIKPRYESAQGFRVAGKITSRLVEVGTPVKKGQPLAKLDPADANLSLSAAKATQQQAEAQFALAKANLERQRQLVDKKFISAATLDRYEAEYAAAAAQRDQTKAQVGVTGNQSAYTTLYADRAGVVTFIRAEPGQVVSAGEVVARIADLSELEAEVALPESRRNQVHEGDAASIILWADRKQMYDARVREIAPMADGATRSFTVRASLLAPDTSIRLGMTAGVKFNTPLEDSLLIPSTALTQQANTPVVWLVNPQTHQVQPHPVTIAQYGEDGALISSGLKNGDTLVVLGVQNLVAGQKVRPVEKRAGQ